MWELNYKEGWVPENWCFATVVLEKTLESPWDSKEIKPVNSKGNQPWIFIGRTNAEAEALILWPPVAQSWLIRKDPGSGKGWGQEEEGAKDNEMAGWHHWLSGHEFEQTLGDGEGQGSLACSVPGVAKNWTELSDGITNNKWPWLSENVFILSAHWFGSLAGSEGTGRFS